MTDDEKKNERYSNLQQGQAVSQVPERVPRDARDPVRVQQPAIK
jgi:hypothetical protein